MTVGCQRATIAVAREWLLLPARKLLLIAEACTGAVVSAGKGSHKRVSQYIYSRDHERDSAFLRFELSPIAPRRSRLRVPQEMGVGLAGAKSLQPHPSTFERSAAQGDIFSPAAADALRRRQSPAQHSRRAGSGHPVADVHSGLSRSCAGTSAIPRSRFHRPFHARSTDRRRLSPPPTTRQACFGGADISIPTHDRDFAAR